MREERRDAGLIGCATIIAIVVPLLAVSLLMAASAGTLLHIGSVFVFVLMFGTPIAAAHVILLWLPAYFFATRESELSWPGAAALGLVCGGLPCFLLLEAEPGATALFAGSGLIGGLAFRATFALSRM